MRKSTVENITGPNANVNVSDLEPKSHQKLSEVPVTPALNERLENVEAAVMDLDKPVPKDVYVRLKALEDRVLLMERINPGGAKIGQLEQSVHDGQNGVKNEPFNGGTEVNAREYKEQLTESLVDINNEIDSLRNSLILRKQIKSEIPN